MVLNFLTYGFKTKGNIMNDLMLVNGQIKVLVKELKLTEDLKEQKLIKNSINGLMSLRSLIEMRQERDIHESENKQVKVSIIDYFELK